jgi:hypothetical protein
MGRQRRIPLTAETSAAIQQQIRAFRQKFGREPGPEDPLFFDPQASEPRPLSGAQMNDVEAQMMEIMAAAGLDPALVYAARKTGRIVTERNAQYLSEAELKEWNDAVEEYDRQAAKNKA